MSAATAPGQGLPFGAAGIIAFWITLSGSLIVFNKYIFSHLHFPYPVFLTAYHMLVATIGTRVIYSLQLPGKFAKPAVQISWPVWRQTIVPLAGLFSASLILSNLAYVHLSVSFVQMLKAFIPILVLVIQLIAGLQKYNHMLMGIIFITCVGCSIAASGEVQFSMFGFVCQILAVIVESSRIVLIQYLLKEYSFDPLSSIAMYAPLCSVMIGALIPVFEGLEPFRKLPELGFTVLLVNGIMAFALNVSLVLVIDAAGSLVLTLSGVFKDILLITCSVVFLGSPVTLTQAGGYSIALVGLIMFRLNGDSTLQSMGTRIASVWDATNGRFSKTFTSTALLIFIAASVTFLTQSGHHSLKTQPVPESYQRHVTYPLGGTIKPGWQEHHGAYVQTAKGADLIPAFDSTIDVSQLPRVGWVVFATPNAITTYASELANMACYAARIGIPFHLEHTIMTTEQHIYTLRHRNAAKWLRFYQWIYVSDADTIVANSKQDLRSYLDDSVDVIFNDRDNLEVCAAAFFIRNSPGGWSFLRRWVSWADHGVRLNGDNSDLVEMFSAGQRPGLPNNANATGRFADAEEFEKAGGYDAAGCVHNASTWTEYAEIVKCMDRTVSHLRYKDNSVPYWDTDLWAWTDLLPPVKARVYKTLGGFFRWGEGDIKKAWHWKSWYDMGISNDFMIGGKALSNFLNADSVLCSGEDWSVMPNELTVSETRKLCKEQGFFWWPGCFDDQKINHCLPHEDSDKSMII